LLVLEKTAAEIPCLAVAQTLLVMVRKEGLEPTRLAALEPKSSASTNSATFAHLIPEESGFLTGLFYLIRPPPATLQTGFRS
jgi:hypothetical protein